MTEYRKKLEVRWADLDPNFHMLHSRYYDLGAFCRMAYLVENKITPQLMRELHFGPILFREECSFKKEIAFGDDISINLKIQKMTEDCSRWTMLHEIWKNNDILAATISCDGAWLDTISRKLTAAPTSVIALFDMAPRTDDFVVQKKASAL